MRWKRNRAEHKKFVKESNRKDWKEFVDSINRDTPHRVVFEKIRRIKGKKKRSINILQDNGQNISNVSEIAEILANVFYRVSSDENYDRKFMQFKVTEEQNAINFNSSSTEYYNKEFTYEKLN